MTPSPTGDDWSGPGFHKTTVPIAMRWLRKYAEGVMDVIRPDAENCMESAATSADEGVET